MTQAIVAATSMHASVATSCPSFFATSSNNNSLTAVGSDTVEFVDMNRRNISAHDSITPANVKKVSEEETTNQNNKTKRPSDSHGDNDNNYKKQRL